VNWRGNSSETLIPASGVDGSADPPVQADEGCGRGVCFRMGEPLVNWQLAVVVFAHVQDIGRRETRASDLRCRGDCGFEVLISRSERVGELACKSRRGDVVCGGRATHSRQRSGTVTVSDLRCHRLRAGRPDGGSTMRLLKVEEEGKDRNQEAEQREAVWLCMVCAVSGVERDEGGRG